MNRVDLLVSLKAFTEETVKDLILPTRVQKGDTESPPRVAEVHLMRLPDSSAATKKAPYILHQLITAKDQQQSGAAETATAQIRTVFCVYCGDEEEGALMLLNLMERLRIRLMRERILSRRYQLDLEAGLEILVYPDDTAPYFMGEMASTWICPAINREVRKWL